MESPISSRPGPRSSRPEQSADLLHTDTSRGLRRLRRRLGGGVRRNGPVIVLVAAGFVARLFLAGWNSYWYDEILSVVVYGISHDSVLEVAGHLARASIHPPLYQMTLFGWMQIFGDSETATRSLSNLYVTGATAFVYLFVAKLASKHVAFAAAAFFSIMYVPTFFALETRSYAQTILLVCLSGYLVLRVLAVYSERERSTTLWRSPSLLLLTLTNTALLMTHYYNLFFWVAQAAFVLAYILTNRAVRNWVKNLWSITASFAIQMLLFAGIWGSVLLEDFRSASAPYRVVNGDLQSPISLLVDNVVTPNFRSPTPVLWLMVVISTWLLIRALIRVIVSRHGPLLVWRSWGIVYLFVTLIGPILVATAAFLVTGVARYNERYFLYCVPAIAALLAVMISEVVESARRRMSSFTRAPSQSALFAAMAFLVAVFWVLPGGHAAATQVKHDWRGIVADVINVVQSDETHSYVIVEAGHRTEPMSNYYFDRLAEEIRAEYTITTPEEQAGSYRVLGELRDRVESYDRLIVVFLHSRTSVGHFPNALNQLEERYAVLHRELRFGRGYVVFDLG
jgi:uncharacterized membrane protein